MSQRGVRATSASWGTALMLAGLITSLPAAAQTWEYRSFKKSRTGQYEKDNVIVGTATLAEKDGKATLTLNAGPMDLCRRGELPVQLTRTDAELTIEVENVPVGCERWRLVIRQDGSGGRREVWRNERWVDTRWDHGLTLAR